MAQPQYYPATRPHDFRNIINSENSEWPPLGPNIQLAVNDLPPLEGGWVLLPQGVLWINQTLMVDKPLKLVGCGGGTSVHNQMTIIALANNSNCDMIRFRALGQVVTDSLIEDVGIYGNSANQAAGSGILFQREAESETLADVFLNRLLIWQCREHGVECIGLSYNLWLTNTMAEYCTLNGFFIEAANTVHLRSPFTIGNGASGIYVNNCAEVNITDPFTRANTGRGIYVRGTTDASLKGGTSRGNGLAGVRLGGSIRSHLSSMNIYDNGSSSPNTIDGVEILAEAGYDALRNRVTDIFSGNVATANQRYGVSLDATAADCRLNGLDLSGNVTGTILDNGTRTRINGYGREAVGGVGPPVDPLWSIGDIICNTFDNTYWLKDIAGVMRQLA